MSATELLFFDFPPNIRHITAKRNNVAREEKDAKAKTKQFSFRIVECENFKMKVELRKCYTHISLRLIKTQLAQKSQS